MVDTMHNEATKALDQVLHNWPQSVLSNLQMLCIMKSVQCHAVT